MVRRSRVLACSVVAVLLVVAGPQAEATTCSVINSRTRETTSDLQRAIRDAGPHDTLAIRGTCVGNFEVRRSITLQGRSTRAYPIPRLSGGGDGGVLLIWEAGRVSIHDLWVTNGREGIGGGGGISIFDSSVTLTGTTSVRGNTSSSAGGIYNDGRLVIRDHVSIVGNRARGWDGGGGIANQGILVIRGAARISRNRAAYWGGGITQGVWGSLTIRGSAEISRNVAGASGGGLHVIGWDVLITDDASIERNRAGYGGGIASCGGRVAVGGDARVVANTAVRGGSSDDMCAFDVPPGIGGGIFAGTGRVTIGGSASVRGNSAERLGGGAYTRSEGGPSRLVVTAGGSITGNTATRGGGVYNSHAEYFDPRVVLKGAAAVIRNVANGAGGGIFNEPGGKVFVCSVLVTISPNDPDDPPPTRSCP